MTVEQLINKLMEQADWSRQVIIDDDGNTCDIPEPKLWDENDNESPLAFFI